MACKEDVDNNDDDDDALPWKPNDGTRKCWLGPTVANATVLPQRDDARRSHNRSLKMRRLGVIVIVIVAAMV